LAGAGVHDDEYGREYLAGGEVIKTLSISLSFRKII
jgi:hypothetical protein